MSQTTVTVHFSITEITAFREFLEKRLADEDGDLPVPQEQEARWLLSRLFRAERLPAMFPDLRHL